MPLPAEQLLGTSEEKEIIISKQLMLDVLSRVQSTARLTVFLSQYSQKQAATLSSLGVEEDGNLPTSFHPSVCPAFKLIESEESYVLVAEYFKNSLLSVSRFHTSSSLSVGSISHYPGDGIRDLRLRFIMFQLLNGVAYLHEQGLCLGNLDPRLIYVDDDMWLQIPVSLSLRSCISAWCSRLQKSEKKKEDEKSVRKIMLESLAEPIIRPPGYYETSTYQWVHGKISNFEYLMKINDAAGRSMGNNLYHPILPWVTDFSSQLSLTSSDALSSLRDLRKTKFRLSKKDRQLETTFEHSDPPHHISESLSELTYCIYMARRTPMQVLRRIVRHDFVPEHYPSSIKRIYEWSPDECIPEFFSDESVFKSIHTKHRLADLELPSFADTPEKFISYHRAVLESDHVSSHLHYWIDLTFGCNLLGQAAIKNMNVPLQIDASRFTSRSVGSSLDKQIGFCVLFEHSHPRKLKKSSSKHPSKSSDLSANSLQWSKKSLRHLDEIDRELRMTQKKQETTIRRASGTVRIGEKMTIEVLEGFKHGGGIDKSLLRSNESSIKEMKREKQNFFNLSIFSEQYSACLEPVRAPSFEDMNTFEGGDTKVASSDDACHISLSKTPLTPGLSSHCENNDNAHDLEILLTLQAQDMFFVGSMIAELYLGRPLISEKWWHELREQSLSVRENEISKMLRNRCPRIPQQVRILVSRLLSGNRAIQPRASEILRACLSADYAEGSDKNSYDSSLGIPCISERADRFSIDPTSWTNHAGSKTFPLRSSENSARSCYDEASLSSSHRINTLWHSCATIFPHYFKTTYDTIAKLKLCSDDEEKFKFIVREGKEILNVLPKAAISFLLPHLQKVLGSADILNRRWLARRARQKSIKIQFPSKSPTTFPSNGESNPVKATFEENYRADPDVHETSSIEDDTFDGIEYDYILIHEYAALVDTLCSRIGTADTETAIVPYILKFLDGITDHLLLCEIIKSDIWRVLLCRVGVPCFLRVFFPILLTYLASGLFKQISSNAKGTTSRFDPVSPLWASPGSYQGGWLLSLREEDLEQIQLVASQVVPSFVDPELLGPGLTTRYILPPLLCLIGAPRLAAARTDIAEGAWIKEEEGHNVKWIKTSAPSDPKQLYMISTIVKLCHSLEELEVLENVLVDIASRILPDIIQSFEASEDIQPSSVAALLEVILLIEGILPALSVDLVHKLFLGSQGCISLLSLLVELPISKPLRSDDLQIDDESYLYHPNNPNNPRNPKITTKEAFEDADKNSLEECDQNVSLEDDEKEIEDQRVRWHLVRSELVRLVMTSVPLLNDEKFIIDKMNPFVDRYFENFVSIFKDTTVDCRAFLEAMDLAVEIILFWQSLVGQEFVFSTLPSVNPKLEMWLSTPPDRRASPPLPPSIQPDFSTVVSAPKSARRSSYFKQGKKFLTGLVSAPKGNGTQNGRKSLYETSFGSSMTTSKWHAINFSHNSPSPTNIKSPPSEPIVDIEGTVVDSNDIVVLQSPTPDTKSTPLETSRNEVLFNVQTPSSFHKRLISAPSSTSTSPFLTSGKKSNKSNSLFGVLTANWDNDEETDKRAHERKRSLTNKIWLLSGYGRWKCGTVSSEKVSGNQSRPDSIKCDPIRNDEGFEGLEKKTVRGTPPRSAYMSMTHPRITCDIANEATENFKLDMSLSTLYDSREPASPIKTMTTNSTESLMLVSYRSGVRIFSLSDFPVKILANYKGHSNIVSHAAFLQSGARCITSDGHLNLWDVETQQTLQIYRRYRDNVLETFCDIELGQTQCRSSGALGSLGDNQVLACTDSHIFSIDTRVSGSNLQVVADWKLNDSRFDSNRTSIANEPSPKGNAHIRCLAAGEFYVLAGTSAGSVHVIDRRTGLSVSSDQADGPEHSMVKIISQGSNRFISVSDKGAASIWDCKSGLLRKAANIKGIPDVAGASINPSNILFNSFEESSPFHYARQDTGSPNYSISVFNCFVGHKSSSGIISSGNSSPRDGINLLGAERAGSEAGEGAISEIKLNSAYFYDQFQNRLVRQKLQIASALLLPLRRILLLGTEEGSLKCVV
jgi:hypothetical protein